MLRQTSRRRRRRRTRARRTSRTRRVARGAGRGGVARGGRPCCASWIELPRANSVPACASRRAVQRGADTRSSSSAAVHAARARTSSPTRSMSCRVARVDADGLARRTPRAARPRRAAPSRAAAGRPPGPWGGQRGLCTATAGAGGSVTTGDAADGLQQRLEPPRTSARASDGDFGLVRPDMSLSHVPVANSARSPPASASRPPFAHGHQPSPRAGAPARRRARSRHVGGALDRVHRAEQDREIVPSPPPRSSASSQWWIGVEVLASPRERYEATSHWRRRTRQVAAVGSSSMRGTPRSAAAGGRAAGSDVVAAGPRPWPAGPGCASARRAGPAGGPRRRV